MPDSVTRAFTSLDRKAMAKRVADIPEGWYVNLGIRIPTLVPDFVPQDREVVFHSENGVLGIGPAPPPHATNRWPINAGKQHVTLRKGGSYVHHTDGFAIIRGGHLDRGLDLESLQARTDAKLYDER